jgi:molybdate transport system permease protein
MSSWLTQGDLVALYTSLKLALLTTALLLAIGTPLAWWLAMTRTRIRPIIEALVTLPMVLPPTVLGFYLLGFLGPRGWAGQLATLISGAPLAFSFTGLLIGSMIYSLPFVVQPLQASFQSTGVQVLEVASTLRASRPDAFFSAVLPLARRGYLSAAVLAFAHTLGEFGVILMIGGNIPGRTQVASIALFNHVEALEYTEAGHLASTLLALCFVLLLWLFYANRRERRLSVAL